MSASSISDKINLSVREAQAYGVGRTTLCDAIASGALPSFKLLNKRLIKRVELEAWLERGGRPVAEVAA